MSIKFSVICHDCGEELEVYADDLDHKERLEKEILFCSFCGSENIEVV